jgi:hypothetical protein
MMAANWQTGIGSFAAAAESLDTADSFKLDVINIESVPEPTSAAVLAAGVFGLLRRRRSMQS